MAIFLGGLLLLTSTLISCVPEADSYRGWQAYLGGSERNHYSSLDQINLNNVAQLEIAWTYHSGDHIANSETQANPIIVDGVLYSTTAGLKVIALDAATGDLHWSFDPFIGIDSKYRPQTRSRGVMYWEDNLDHRILFTAGLYLYALNAEDGQLVASFGNNGKVDLRTGIERDTVDMYIRATTPGAIYKDLLILGSLVPDGQMAAPPGDIRAFDVRTGELRWIFHTIPHPGEFGYDTWPEDCYTYTGGANNWAGMAVDHERGMVFLPTGSPTFDFWGGNRKGKNLFGNTLLALNAETGERLWHFQVVRHDLWDYDLPAPPNIVTIERYGERIDAVAQITKTGHVFVFDRETGKSLFPLEEKEYPSSDLQGEEAWPTQVLPTLPKPFSRQTYTKEEYSDLDPETIAFIRERLQGVKQGGQYIPPSTEGVVILGLGGGGQWGGAAVDVETGIMYVNGNQTPYLHQMVEIAEQHSLGQRLYATSCASCHGSERQGNSLQSYPSLKDVGKRLTGAEMRGIVRKGKGVMPGFRQFSSEEIRSLVSFLQGKEVDGALGKEEEFLAPPYGFNGFNRFLDEEGYPAINPPWGTLNAINLNTGAYEWTTPLGEFEELTARGIPPTGVENIGGPVVTAGGLVFIGATKDEKFRAFNKATGEELWETTLPAGGYATPSTYEVNGKQYVVIACGGGKMGTKSGDAYIAFSLPD